MLCQLRSFTNSLFVTNSCHLLSFHLLQGLRLPDRGERLRKQISELNTELVNLTTPEKTNQVIDLDDITDALQRSSLHV